MFSIFFLKKNQNRLELNIQQQFYTVVGILYPEFRRNGEETLTTRDQTRTSLIYCKNLTICIKIDVNADFIKRIEIITTIKYNIHDSHMEESQAF